MQTGFNNIWKETQRLSRKERIELMEKLIHQLRIEDIGDEEYNGLPSWEEIYGMGKGIWKIDAQEYVDQLREERY